MLRFFFSKNFSFLQINSFPIESPKLKVNKKKIGLSLLIRYGIQSERLINVSKYDVFVLLSVFFMSAYSSLSNKTKNRNKFNIFYSNIGDIDRYPYTFRWQNRMKIIMTPKRRLILVFMIYLCIYIFWISILNLWNSSWSYM